MSLSLSLSLSLSFSLFLSLSLCPSVPLSLSLSVSLSVSVSLSLSLSLCLSFSLFLSLSLCPSLYPSPSRCMYRCTISISKELYVLYIFHPHMCNSSPFLLYLPKPVFLVGAKVQSMLQSPIIIRVKTIIDWVTFTHNTPLFYLVLLNWCLQSQSRLLHSIKNVCGLQPALVTKDYLNNRSNIKIFCGY